MQRIGLDTPSLLDAMIAGTLACERLDQVEPAGTHPTSRQIETRDHVRAAFEAAGLHHEGIKIGWDEAHIPTAIAQRLIDLYLAAKTALER